MEQENQKSNTPAVTYNGNKIPVGQFLVEINNQLEKRQDRLVALLEGTGISPVKFRYQAVSQLQKKPELVPYVASNLGAFMSAVMECAEQGLDFSRPNEAHLVPIGDKVVLFRGYKGLAKMARRSPNVLDVDFSEVYANDFFEIEKGSNRSLVHKPPARGVDRGELTDFYAVAYLRAGPAIFDSMTVEEIEKHARRFIKAKKGPFADVKTHGRKAENFVAYGLKTVLTRLCFRKLDLSSELAEVFEREFEAEPVENGESQGAMTLAEKMARRKAEAAEDPNIQDAEIISDEPNQEPEADGSPEEADPMNQGGTHPTVTPEAKKEASPLKTGDQVQAGQATDPGAYRIKGPKSSRTGEQLRNEPPAMWRDYAMSKEGRESLTEADIRAIGLYASEVEVPEPGSNDE